MNLKRSIKKFCLKVNKSGSYIFEAAMILPFMVIAITVLASLIPAIATFENSMYSACDELRESSIRQAFFGYDVALQVKLRKRVLQENKNIEGFYIKKFVQGKQKYGMKDIMLLDYSFNVRTDNPTGIADSIDFDSCIMARAFTGKKINGLPIDESEFKESGKSEKVFVFPKNGEKYHKLNCKYLNPACKSICLTNKIKRRWKTCSLCKSEKVQTGNMVFCFPSSGKVYHSGECSTVKKYYIEIEKYYAKKKGYSSCLSCGS